LTAPTVPLAPEFLVLTTGSNTESMLVDWWAMKIQGLAR
jgi:hypothetical protein